MMMVDIYIEVELFQSASHNVYSVWCYCHTALASSISYYACPVHAQWVQHSRRTTHRPNVMIPVHDDDLF